MLSAKSDQASLASLGPCGPQIAWSVGQAASQACPGSPREARVADLVARMMRPRHE